MANAAFVNPMKFDGSEAQKKVVIEYIQARVKKEDCDGQLDMCNYTTIKMMYDQNGNASKEKLA
jgi:hypothetical protein